MHTFIHSNTVHSCKILVLTYTPIHRRLLEYTTAHPRMGSSTAVFRTVHEWKTCIGRYGLVWVEHKVLASAVGLEFLGYLGGNGYHLNQRELNVETQHVRTPVLSVTAGRQVCALPLCSSRPCALPMQAPVSPEHCGVLDSPNVPSEGSLLHPLTRAGFFFFLFLILLSPPCSVLVTLNT